MGTFRSRKLINTNFLRKNFWSKYHGALNQGKIISLYGHAQFLLITRTSALSSRGLIVYYLHARNPRIGNMSCRLVLLTRHREDACHSWVRWSKDDQFYKRGRISKTSGDRFYKRDRILKTSVGIFRAFRNRTFSRIEFRVVCQKVSLCEQFYQQNSYTAKKAILRCTNQR